MYPTFKTLPNEKTSASHILETENQALKEQIKSLQEIEDEYQDKLFLINELKGEIEVWKSKFQDNIFVIIIIIIYLHHN